MLKYLITLLMIPTLLFGETQILRPDANGATYPNGWDLISNAYQAVDEDPHDGATTEDGTNIDDDFISYSLGTWETTALWIDSISFTGVFKENSNDDDNGVIPFFIISATTELGDTMNNNSSPVLGTAYDSHTVTIDCPTTSTGSFTIDSSSATEFTYIYAYDDQYNYGGIFGAKFGDGYVPGTRTYNALIRFPDLADSMREHGAGKQITWDSAKIGLYIDASGNLSSGVSIPDSLIVTPHKITTAGWQKGTSNGSDGGGVTWDSASATGTGSVPDNLDWTSNGGDYSATIETCCDYEEKGDSIVWVGGEDVADDTVYVGISGATISDTMGNDGGIELISRVVDGDAASNSVFLVFGNSNMTSNEQKWPTITVYYTIGWDSTKIEALETGMKAKVAFLKEVNVTQVSATVHYEPVPSAEVGQVIMIQ